MPREKRWNNSSFLEIPGTLPRKCVLKDKESFFFCDGPYIHIIQSILSLSIWAGCYRSQDVYRSIIIQKYFKWETYSGHRLLILLFLHKNWLWVFICMHVCTHREQKVSDTLELELKMVVTQYHGELGIETRFLTMEPSPAMVWFSLIGPRSIYLYRFPVNDLTHVLSLESKPF